MYIKYCNPELNIKNKHSRLLCQLFYEFNTASCIAHRDSIIMPARNKKCHRLKLSSIICHSNDTYDTCLSPTSINFYHILQAMFTIFHTGAQNANHNVVTLFSSLLPKHYAQEKLLARLNIT